MSVQMRPNEDHEVLGSEYCSEYTDSFGKWNKGFYCPTLDTTEAVYCCGSTSYKYCCTKKDEEIPNLLLVLGVVAGIVMAIVMVTMVSCFFCSCCVLYKRRQTSINGGPLYQMHCSSTGSGVANMYSFSNQNSSVTTPVDTAGPHPIVDLDFPPATLPVASSPSSHLPQSFAADTPTQLTRTVTMDQCHIPVEEQMEMFTDQREESLSPCLGSSPSVSISFRDPTPKGVPCLDARMSCSPSQSVGRHSSATCSPPRISHSPSIASGIARCSPPVNEESLFRSTKF